MFQFDINIVEDKEEEDQDNICYLLSNIKRKYTTKREHEHDIVYQEMCPEPNCLASYIGEAGKRFVERIKDHCGRDKNFHVLKHCIETGHKVDLGGFKIIGGNYRSNSVKRKISEALYIKEHKPNLNIQGKSWLLKLLN